MKEYVLGGHISVIDASETGCRRACDAKVRPEMKNNLSVETWYSESCQSTVDGLIEMSVRRTSRETLEKHTLLMTFRASGRARG